MDIKQCERCGRALKSAKSKEDGYGPVCLRKHLAEQADKERSNEDEQPSERA